MRINLIPWDSILCGSRRIKGNICIHFVELRGFPSSSAGKESTCNAGDPGLIPGSGRSTEEGIGYPLQDSWASLVAQLVKNLTAMGETRVRSLGWYSPWSRKESDTTDQLSLHCRNKGVIYI